MVTSAFPAPPQSKSLGMVKTKGHTGIDDNVQLENLARKVVKKGANLVCVSDFIFYPGSSRVEGLIEGEMYLVSNYDSLKSVLVKRNTPLKSGYSEVIFYRPLFGLKKVDENPLKLKVDTFNIELGANKAIKFEFKNDSAYFIKVPDYAMLKLVVKSGITNFVRCSYKENTEAQIAGVVGGIVGAIIYVGVNGRKAYYLPDILVGRSNEMKELEYLMSGFAKY